MIGWFLVTFTLITCLLLSFRSRITLLYKCVRGVAGRSFGLNVARLANLPASVVCDVLAASAQWLMVDVPGVKSYGAVVCNGKG